MVQEDIDAGGRGLTWLCFTVDYPGSWLNENVDPVLAAEVGLGPMPLYGTRLTFELRGMTYLGLQVLKDESNFRIVLDEVGPVEGCEVSERGGGAGGSS